MVTYEPRPYQTKCISALADARANGINRGLVVMASGLGKTLTAAFDIEQYLQEHINARVLVLCHQENILLQTKRKFQQYFGEEYSYGMYSGSYKVVRRVDFTFATFQSMHRHRAEFANDIFDYIVVDEAHHTPATTYRPTVDYFQAQFLLGLTATKDRMDGQDILDTYRQQLFSMDIFEGWRQGYLARVEYNLMLNDLDEKTFKQYLQPQDANVKLTIDQLNKTFCCVQTDADLVASIRKETSDLTNPTIFIFCNSIAQAESLAHHFGGEAAMVHSKQSFQQNQAILDAFYAGDIKIILSVNMLNEGIDIPAADVVVFLRATDSQIVFYQQLGRGARITEGKRTLRVLDYVANVERLMMVLKMEARANTGSGASDTRIPPIEVKIPKVKFTVRKIDIEKILEIVRTSSQFQWTDEALLRAFKQKAEELGRTPRQQDLADDPKMPSLFIYLQHFGSMVKVALLCGLMPNRDRFIECSDEELLEKLRQKSRGGLMPSYKEVNDDPAMPHPSVYHKRFGAWDDIANLAGLKMTRFQSGYFDKKNRDEMIQILQAEAEKLKGKKLSRSYWMTHPELPAVDSIRKVFGSWNAALEAAGLPINQKMISDEEALEALKAKAQQLGRAPTGADVDSDKTMLSSVSYRSRFGSFPKALDLAGLQYDNRSGWSRSAEGKLALRTEMLRKLHDAIEKNDKIPQRSEFKQLGLPSPTTYKRHFGSVDEAIRLATNFTKDN